MPLKTDPTIKEINSLGEITIEWNKKITNSFENLRFL
jgi:hypothetical protein